jgi:Leucine-rich repeat (LRR) protein
LQVLILSHNQLTSIPAELFRPTAGLRVVDVSDNRLHSLPEALFNSGGMERLALADNQLTDMPVPSLGPAAAASLCELDLSGNAIASLNSPDDFSRFKVGTQRRYMHCGNQFGR